MRNLILVLFVFVLVGCTPKTESTDTAVSKNESSESASNETTDSENDSKKQPETDNSEDTSDETPEEDFPVETLIAQNESELYMKKYYEIMYRYDSSKERVNTALKKEAFRQTKRGFIENNEAWAEKYNFLINKKYDVSGLNFMPVSERSDADFKYFGVNKISGVHYEKYENLLFETIEWIQKTNDELDDVLKVKDFVCESQKEEVDCSQHYIFPIKKNDNVPSLLRRN